MNENLKPYLDRSASTDLPYLLKAKEESKKRMNDQPSAKNIDAFNKASQMLEAHLAKADSSAPASAGFKTVDMALAHLKEKGWKVSRSKIFADAGSGMLKRQADGSILAPDLDRYVVEARLKLAGAAPKDGGEMAKLKIRQTKAEIREREAKASLAEMSEREKAGELISREEADIQMAMAVTILRAQLRAFLSGAAPEIVHIVGGDPKKMDALLDLLTGKTNDFFNGFSKKQEFRVACSEPAELG
jgi:hypothetical protein